MDVLHARTGLSAPLVEFRVRVGHHEQAARLQDIESPVLAEYTRRRRRPPSVPHGTGALPTFAAVSAGPHPVRPAPDTSGIELRDRCPRAAVASVTYYTYLPEVFPTRLRGIGSGVVASIARVAGMVSGVAVAAIYSGLGATTLFFILAGGLLIMGAVVAGFGPKTSRRSLEQIEQA